MPQISKPIYRIVLIHLLFWAVYTYYQAVIYNWRDTDEFRFDISFHVGGLDILIAIIVTYINLNILLPVFYYRRRFLLYGSSLMLNLFSGALLTRFITHELILPWEALYDPVRYALEVKKFWIPLRILRLAVQYLPVIAISTVLELMYKALQEEKHLRETEREHTAIELKYLKAQINPHFFFNTMNSLYALILNGSTEAAGLVMRLSRLMRYIIYQSGSEMTDLFAEVAELENYLSIEQTRFADRLDLSFSVSGNLNQRIIPLILLPFAENAVKHGIENGEGWITVIIRINDGSLYYQVENPIAVENKKSVPGIGLQNLRRRLELAYPGKHELITSENGQVFTAEVKLKL